MVKGEREGFTERLVLHYNRDLKEPSRRLREGMAEAERLLWTKIRMGQINGFRFSRQRPIGNYIVDFFYHKAKLVIEIDGSQHFSDWMIENDRVRDELLSSLGLRVLRFTNTDVLSNIAGVVESIVENLGEEIPLSPPFSKGETPEQRGRSLLPLVKGD